MDFSVEHLSRDSFLHLLDLIIVIVSREKKIYFSRNESSPEVGKKHFVSSPSFDFTLSGTKHILFPDHGCKDILMKPGSVHYCPKGHWKLPLWDNYHKISSIIFYPKFIRFTFIDFNQATEISYDTHAAGTFYHTNSPINESGMLIIQAMDNIILNNDDVSSIPFLLKGLLVIVRDALKNDKPHSTGKKNHSWIKIKHYLQDNFQRPINRNYVAKEFKMSPSYISQLFAEKEPLGFIGLLRDMRLKHGAFLLTATDLTVDEITQQCGYASTSYFISEFKKKYGLSPSQYRLYRQ